MEKNVIKIFTECQTSTATHPKLITKLTKIYLKSDFEKFTAHFIHLMKYSLIHEDKHPVIEKTLAFVAKFSTSVKTIEEEKAEKGEEVEDQEEDYDVDPFLVAIFKFLLQNHDANSRAVRLRVCQLINRILNSMGEQASIDDQLYNTIYDTMLQRLMDKVPAVRVQAIHALSRLQDPRNKECPVIKAYLFHLSMDPNPEVRRAVLSNIAITFQTLPDILDRIRDTRDLVRRQTYLTLAQKVHLRSFTIAQRILIASEGLNDRSEMVRQVVRRNLLQAWLRLVNGSVLELLKCLDVEASTESAELVLKSLFEDVPYSSLLENFGLLDGNKLVPLNQLKPEAALYWKCLARHLRAEKAEDYLDEFLPDLSVFCDYLREWILKSTAEEESEQDSQETAVKMMEKEFVCQQLIDLTAMFDLSDEVGRQNLCSLVRQLLFSATLGDACIKSLSEIFALLYPPVARITQLAEIISDLREPPESATQKTRNSVPCTPKVQDKPELSEEERRKNKIKIAQLCVKINEVRDQLEECVRSLDLDLARELKDTLKHLELEKDRAIEEGPTTTPHTTPVVPNTQVRILEEEELKQLDDPQTLSRCLLLVCEFLSIADITTLSPTLRSLHDDLILPCLKSEDLSVRRFAVRALALTSLLSKELAQQHLLLFVQISRMDVEEIQSEALRGLFDFWLMYGVEEFNTAAEDINELPGFAFEDSPESAEEDQTERAAVGNMVALLTKMLETESSDARTLTVEGLCKLLLSSRICSSKLLSHLILLWYNPNTEDDHLLRHILGVFFPVYASLGGSHQESFCGALIPTLHTLFGAPARSPLADVDVEDVVNFMVSITSPAIVSSKSSDIGIVNAHDSLVFSVCAEILAFPDRDYIRALVKCLPQLTISPSNFVTLRQVLCLSQKMVKKIEEKRLLNYISKFQQVVQNALQLAPKADENEVTTVQGEDATTSEIETDGETTLQNASQFNRKRILYSSQNDMQLMSDLDLSETELTPSKTKRLSENLTENVIVNPNNSKHAANKVTVSEEESESVSESEAVERETVHSPEGSKVITVTQEIELTMTPQDSSSEKAASKSSSSDLFRSAEEDRNDPNGSKEEASFDVSVLEESSEEEESVNEQSSSCSTSPPRKSPKLKMLQSPRDAKTKSQNKRSKESRKSSRSSQGSVSSSSSFYSTRSTTKSSDVSSSSTIKVCDLGDTQSSTEGGAAEGKRVTRSSLTASDKKMNTRIQARRKLSVDKNSGRLSVSEPSPQRRQSPASSTNSSGRVANTSRRLSNRKKSSSHLEARTSSTTKQSTNRKESPVVRHRAMVESSSESSSVVTTDEEGNDKRTEEVLHRVKRTSLRSSSNTTPVSTPTRTHTLGTKTRTSSRLTRSVTSSSEDSQHKKLSLRSAKKK